MRIMPPEEVYRRNAELDAWLMALPYRVKAEIRSLVIASQEIQKHLEWDRGYEKEHPREAAAGETTP